MERCNYVELYDGSHHNLEEINNHIYKMDEIEGEIISCESKSLSRGLCLVMRLKDFGKEVRWYEEKISLPALVGQILRGFCEKDKDFIIDIKAYELLEDDKVLRRGCINNNYKFIEA